MATSRVAAAIDALYALLRAAMPAEVTVSDGPVTAGESAPDVLAVGAGPDPEAVDGRQTAAALGAYSREDRFDVACTISTFQETPAAARSRAFELFGLIEDVLRPRPNNTLGGAVRYAEVTSYALIQRATEHGPYAAITFTVACQARI